MRHCADCTCLPNAGCRFSGTMHDTCGNAPIFKCAIRQAALKSPQLQQCSNSRTVQRNKIKRQDCTLRGKKSLVAISYSCSLSELPSESHDYPSRELSPSRFLQHGFNVVIQLLPCLHLQSRKCSWPPSVCGPPPIAIAGVHPQPVGQYVSASWLHHRSSSHPGMTDLLSRLHL